MRTTHLLLAASIWAFPLAARADMHCVGDRIENGSSTWGFAKDIGGGYRIEKASSTIGWAKDVGDGWRLESAGGSTIGWLKGDRIEHANGLTRTTLSSATARCAPPIAAALYVLGY